ncbi:MAG: Fic family protein [Bacilli bacterium]|nr:Fic family protein [Bacilli bacterium]MDD4066104.1 Fic family protein [Bacilli bacterium]
MDKIIEIQELLTTRADLKTRLASFAYNGTPTIKTNSGKQYIYLRKRVAGRVTSTYVGAYSLELFNSVSLICRQHREVSKSLRHVEKRLIELGYFESEANPQVLLNIEFGRVNLKYNIYNQAVLEGVGTTFIQTETILENGKVKGVTPTDIQKIINLKHAWELILDIDVLRAASNYYLASYIASIVNEGFFANGGKLREVPVTIGGSNYILPLPLGNVVKEEMQHLCIQDKEPVEVAIDLLLYVMKKQLFNDGNKRTGVILANHYLISKGAGLLVIPEQLVPTFKLELINYYENKSNSIRAFLKTQCWKTFK